MREYQIHFLVPDWTKVLSTGKQVLETFQASQVPCSGFTFHEKANLLVAYLFTEQPLYQEATRVVGLLKNVENARLHMAVSVSDKTIVSLLKQTKGNRPWKQPVVGDPENELWMGVTPHSEWREGSLPLSVPEVKYWGVCLRCFQKLGKHKCVEWMAPTALMDGLWGHVGIHSRCPKGK